MSKSTYNKVALYLAAMLFLNCSVLWRTRQSIAQGLPDFSIFYTAARIVSQGDAARLYDNDLQESVQNSFSPGGAKLRGSLLPYNHPPFEALFFLPLAHFSYLTGYWIWLAFNLLLLSVLPFILRPQLPQLQQLPLYLWILASLSFFPIFASIIKGQDSVLLLCLSSLAFACLCRNREGLAGTWVGLGLFKYNLVVPFASALVRRKRFLSMFLGTALVLVLISALVTGWTGLLNYPGYVWSAEHNPGFVWNNSDGNSPNLRGIISTVLPLNGVPRLALIVAVSLVILLLSWRANRTMGGTDPLALAIAIVGAELVSYHAFVHDLSVLYLPILIALDQLFSGQQIPHSSRRILLVCLLIFFCSPIYMVLMLRLGQLQILAIVILIFFFSLLKLKSSRNAAAQTV